MELPSDSQLLLYVVALLALWLLTRVQRREVVRQRRRAPMSHDELGRVLFEIARNQDLQGWRGVFLAGAEVQQVLGDDARGYLDARNTPRLAASLRAIGLAIPQDATYHALHLDDAEDATMEVRLPDGGVRPIPVGKVARVGGVWRMHTPA
ncbi:MAG: hypothetical protein Q8P18_18550 [Pseudomonadota bacterium]|nr:hypothetical protein [Pseudomonadota bacterium]